MGLDLSKSAREEFAKLGDLIAPTGIDKSGKFDISGDIVKSGATAATAGGSIAAYNAAEQAQRDYDEMMAGKEADAAADRQARIEYITQNMQEAGFSQEEIDDALRNAGFKKGGRVGFKEGGGDFDFTQALSDMFDAIREAQETQAGVLRDEEEKEKEIKEAIRQLDLFRDEKAKGGVMATRVGFEEGGSSSIEQQKRENYFDLKRDDFMSMSEYLESGLSDTDLRSGAAEGGIMNLKVKGMPAEMDLRRGGFVPIGAKEKADDVPARLSKNEFVMTADAVRAAGGGSVNKGAKKMYDLMNKLEARV
jgi:DNA-binding transcriptional MerR regulator